ncbi:tautomerase family protein [Shewanella avicenniae]|uniref:Tautomerase family protein n=1 Tax=Shewanella avicenniae TaxID=2814294 RepID=A0ABX7QSF0_9GAMM|nr:tautomerase family protein [Shewanella avicenniae]QSX34396.1 tautomerase family protein [Shewanella avicenniae]
MPLLVFDVVEGQNVSDLRTMLDCAHQVVLEVFKVPARDRYQIVNEHKAGLMVIEDTGLGFERSRQMTVLRVFTSPRPQEQKHLFMQRLAAELAQQCGIRGEDLMISFFTNEREDWSFGMGEAQYATGKL